MKMKKRLRGLLATMTALVLLLGMVPFAAVAEEPTVLTLDTPLEVTATFENPAALSFTPVETGVYVLYSEDGTDPQATLYEAEGMERVVYADDQPGSMQFRLAYTLIAGTEYIYKVDNYGDSTPFSVTLMRGIAPESVTIDGVENGTVTIPMSNANTYFEASVFPENADAILSWASGDENIFSVYDGEVTLTRLGTATLTVTTGAVSDTITVNVVEPAGVWSEGENKAAFTTDEYYQVATFTPSDTGRYRFHWDGELRKYCKIAILELWDDGQTSFIDESFDSNGRPCNMGAYLEEGHTYIVTLKYEGDHQDIETTLTIGKEVAATGLSFVEGTGVSVVYGATEYFTLTPVFAPILAGLQNIEWESSDTDVAEVDWNGDVGTVMVKALGTVTITATTDNDVKARFVLNVIEQPTMQLDTEYSFTSHAVTDGVWNGYETRWAFTPEVDGRYILTFGPEDGVGAYFHSTKEDGDGYYVVMSPGKNWLDLKAGEPYEFVVYTDQDWNVSTTFMLQKLLPPTSVTFAEDNVVLGMFDRTFLEYTMTPDNTDLADVSFTTSNDAIVTVDQDGEIHAVGVGNAVITVTTPNGKTDTVTVTVNRPAALYSEKTESVIITPFDEHAAFELTVKEDGWYEIFFEDGFDVWATLYEWDDKEGVSEIGYSDAAIGESDCIVQQLEKDKLYYLEVSCDEELAQFTVTVRACEEPEEDEVVESIENGVNILKDSLTVSVGDLFFPGYVIGGVEEIETTVSSNTDVVAKVNAANDAFLAVAPGRATLTYTTNAGNTDTIEVTVEGEFRTLTKDQPVTVTSDEEIRGYAYRFVPAASGRYEFYSQYTDGDPYVKLFDSELQELNFNDDRDEGITLDFCLLEELTADKTYYVLFTAWSIEATYTAGVTTPTAATDFTVEVDRTDCLFVEDGVYYVQAYDNVDLEIVFTPYHALVENLEYHVDGNASAGYGGIYFEQVGEVTLTITADDLEDVVFNFRAVNALRGDLNFDDTLDEADVAMLTDHLRGKTVLGRRALLANMDRNGVIDIHDLLLLQTAAGTEGIVAVGDADGNNKVDSTDARLALQCAVGKIDKTGLNAAWADVDGNGKIDSTDARLILQFAVGKIEQFPIEQ